MRTASDDELRAIVRELLMYLSREDLGFRDGRNARRVLDDLAARLDPSTT